MPIDASIALAGQQPNAMGTLSGLLDMRNTMQAYQNMQQQNQIMQNESQQQQNMLGEYNAARALMQDPSKYTDENGNFDMGKASADIMRVAPTVGPQMINNMEVANRASTAAKEEINNLNDQQRQQVAEFAMAQQGKPPAEAMANIQAFGQKFGLGNATDFATKYLLGPAAQAEAGGQKGAFGQALLKMGQSVMNMPNQVTAITPSGPIINNGKSTTMYNTAPMAGETGAPVVTAQNYLSPQIVQDSAGNMHVVGGGSGGASNGGAVPPHHTVIGTGTTSPDGSEFIPQMPKWSNKMQADNSAAAQQRWSGAQNRDVDQVAGYEANSATYRELFDLLKKNPNLGPGSAGWNQVIGRINTLAGTAGAKLDNNADYQTAIGFLDRLSAQNASASGATTNFGRAQAENATGNPEVMGPQALYNKLAFGASINEAQHAYALASQAYTQRHGDAAYANPQLFEQTWSKNANQDVFRLIADNNRGDQQDFNSTIAQLAKSGKKAQALQQYRNIKMLMQGRIPSGAGNGK